MDDRDELIERAAGALRTLPSPNPMATARIVAAVRARRAQAPSRFTLALEWMGQGLAMPRAGFLAAAGLLVGFVTGALIYAPRGADVAAPAVAEAPDAGVPVVAASEVRSAVRPVPVPIAFFEARDAKQVAIVGDFNDWQPTASPMKRLGAAGPWTATVFVTPGRHVYAFLVDGATLVADPRAPHARDLDYGKETSVLMVAAP